VEHGREVERVHRIKGEQILVRSNPILDAGKAVGAVFTLSRPSDVEQTFRRLRAHEKTRPLQTRYTFDHIVQTSPQMQQVVRRCKTLASHSEASILISGPTGVGKELLAQGIHSAGKRRAQKFLAVNCGALAPSLLESELFGYHPGAFTGASREGRRGLFEVAHEGTVFLDEIGELPLELQTRLLRVLQEKEVTRVGSHDPVPVDVRIIAATHRDLMAMVQEGSFRADLYYRLNVVPVDILPLKDRPEDLETLALQMVEAALREAGQSQTLPKVRGHLPDLLRMHTWPGNARELQNFAHRVAILTLELGGAPGKSQLRTLIDFSSPSLRTDDLSLRRKQEDFAHIERMLRECGGSYDATAQRLGISRSTLWRRLKNGRDLVAR
jgi:propionate catabolism operon transcriptional regulator